MQKKTGCFEIKAAPDDQVCTNRNVGNASSQARTESRERALMNDPGLRIYFETSVGVISANREVRRRMRAPS